MEPLWSQAGATGGNRPQAHLPASVQEGAQPRGAGARGAAGERHTGGDGRFSESARWPAGGEPRSDLVSFFVKVIVTVSVTNQEYGRERSRSTNLLITEDV